MHDRYDVRGPVDADGHVKMYSARRKARRLIGVFVMRCAYRVQKLQGCACVGPHCKPQTSLRVIAARRPFERAAAFSLRQVGHVRVVIFTSVVEVLSLPRHLRHLRGLSTIVAGNAFITRFDKA